MYKVGGKILNSPYFCPIYPNHNHQKCQEIAVFAPY